MGNLTPGGMDQKGGAPTLCVMRKRKPPKEKHTRTFVRQWRLHRRLTLEQLAERIGSTDASVSRIERGLQPYTQQTLEALAKALDCTPADLIQRDPGTPAPIWEIWSLIPESEQERATEVLRALAKKTG